MASINIYCDESSHLQHNENRIMTLGYISCDRTYTRQANEYMRFLKSRHGLSPHCELKWVKVSMSKMGLYEDLIKWFMNSDYLQFRCVVADKTGLDYDRFQINHDDWYYRMYYLLLGKTLNETNEYSIYIDIKDTCSSRKVEELKNVLNRSYYDFYASMIQKVQQIHSHEVELLQLADLFIGAVGYQNNGLISSPAKLEIIKLLGENTGCRLDATTSLAKKKFNIFVWEAR